MLRPLGTLVVLVGAGIIIRTLLIHVVLGTRLYNSHFQKNLNVWEFFLQQAWLDKDLKKLLKSPVGSLSPEEEGWRHAIVASSRLVWKLGLGLVLVLIALFLGVLILSEWQRT